MPKETHECNNCFKFRSRAIERNQTKIKHRDAHSLHRKIPHCSLHLLLLSVYYQNEMSEIEYSEFEHKWKKSRLNTDQTDVKSCRVNHDLKFEITARETEQKQ